MSDAPALPAAPSDSSEPAPAEADYAMLTDALTQTQRGRWFLAEHARRSQQAQQSDLLLALARIERALAQDREPSGLAELRERLAALAQAFEGMRAELAEIRPAVATNGERARDEEMLRLLREQRERLDALADVWAHAHMPAAAAQTPSAAALVAAPPPAAAAGGAAQAASDAPGRFLPADFGLPVDIEATLGASRGEAANGGARSLANEPGDAEASTAELLNLAASFDLACNSLMDASPTARPSAAADIGAAIAPKPAGGADASRETAMAFAVGENRIDLVEAPAPARFFKKAEDAAALAGDDPVLVAGVSLGEGREGSVNEGEPTARLPAWLIGAEKNADIAEEALAEAACDATAAAACESPAEAACEATAAAACGAAAEAACEATAAAACEAAAEAACEAPADAACEATAASLSGDVAPREALAPEPAAADAPPEGDARDDTSMSSRAVSDPLAPVYALSEEEQIALFT